MYRSTKIEFPDWFTDLAQASHARRKKEVENKVRKEKQEKKEHEEIIRLNIARGLPFARELFDWATAFRRNKDGKKFLESLSTWGGGREGNFDLFREKVPEQPWRLIGLSASGIFWMRTGCGCGPEYVHSAEQLAAEVNSEILKAAWEHVQSGKVWLALKNS